MQNAWIQDWVGFSYDIGLKLNLSVQTTRRDFKRRNVDMNLVFSLSFPNFCEDFRKFKTTNLCSCISY